MSEAVRVLVVDDHPVFRMGMVALLSSLGLAVVAEAASAEEAVAAADAHEPDVVLMDLHLGTSSGVDATREIVRRHPGIGVLVVTMLDDDSVFASMRAGARGYLLKGESEDKLLEALEALSRHQPYFSPSVSETLLQGYLHSETSHDLKQLTPRERQIVKLVAEGKSNKTIAAILNLSIKTVETHRSAAMHKVGARSAADLTLYAARNDLVQL